MRVVGGWVIPVDAPRRRVALEDRLGVASQLLLNHREFTEEAGGEPGAGGVL
jgi:hypothetical protein